MSHWNKIEGAIWHIEKKVIPIPENGKEYTKKNTEKVFILI